MVDNNNNKFANTYIETYTGRKFDVLNPQSEDISIIDIAHALSMMCRFSGHCKRFYSVSQHSVLVSLNSPGYELWGLLHDASEAYLSDIVSPVKPHLANYKELETNIMKAICNKFDLPEKMPKEVHVADVEMLRVEAYHLMTSKGVNWKANAESDNPIWEMDLNPLAPEKAKLLFLERFNLLTN